MHANRVCESVQERCPEAICVTHQSLLTPGDELPLRTMAAFVTHPNVSHAIVVALSPSDPGWQALSAEVARTGGPGVELVTLLEQGGVGLAIEQTVQSTIRALDEAGRVEREPIPVSELVLGTECGGSDANSGLTANPVLGRCADRVVEAGGSVILAEMTEFGSAPSTNLPAVRPTRASVGAWRPRWARWGVVRGLEFGRTSRARIPVTATSSVVSRRSKRSRSAVSVRAGPAGRRSRWVRERSQRRGLVVMDTSGDDLEQLIAMTAGGANVIVFTTGRGRRRRAPPSRRSSSRRPPRWRLAWAP